MAGDHEKLYLLLEEMPDSSGAVTAIGAHLLCLCPHSLLVFFFFFFCVSVKHSFSLCELSYVFERTVLVF